MTFKQFEETVKHFRNDVIVSAHGYYCTNKSKNTLGVVFLKNGNQSRVYKYSGSYEDVLAQLNITDYYTEQEIANYEYQISCLESRNGKKNLFTVGVADHSQEIERLKDKMSHLLTLYKAC